MLISTKVYTVDFIDSKGLMAKTGLEKGGKSRLFFMNEIIRLSDDYAPMSTGVLKENITRAQDGTYFEYNMPYARYMWYGKLMVDPITKKGAFYSPSYGYWSRPDTKKELTDTDLKYQGAPKRGTFWVKRMWADYGTDICQSVERYIKHG